MRYEKVWISSTEYCIRETAPDGGERFVVEDQPDFLDWLADGNELEELPYVPPPPAPEPTLEEVKALKLEELVNARNNAIDNDGAEYNGLRFWADKGSKSDIHFAIMAYDETEHLEPFWKAMDGLLPISSRADLIGIATAIGLHVSAQFSKYFELIARAEAAGTIEEVEKVEWR